MSPYEQLIGAIESNGVDRYEAEHAARKCAAAMAKYGVLAYSSGAVLMYFLNMTPAGPASAAMAFGAGAGYALIERPECERVREAVRFWNTAAF